MSYKVLIVQDSATARAMLKRTILRSGLSVARVFEADNGRDALEFLAEHPVDLVLADLNDPEMDAIEMVGRILSEPATRAVPVVILSNQCDPRVIDRLRRAGARGCLRTPITPELLRQALSEILEPTHV